MLAAGPKAVLNSGTRALRREFAAPVASPMTLVISGTTLLVMSGTIDIMPVGSKDSTGAKRLAAGPKTVLNRGTRSLRRVWAAPVASPTMLVTSGTTTLVIWGTTDTIPLGSKDSIGAKTLAAGPKTPLSRGTRALRRELAAPVTSPTTLVTTGGTDKIGAGAELLREAETLTIGTEAAEFELLGDVEMLTIG